ncbi:MAG: hypothetical protein M3164_07965 [Actinomycetota bacterium]|nr:hypothetical protein [Actinomycetota bacterium]
MRKKMLRKKMLMRKKMFALLSLVLLTAGACGGQERETPSPTRAQEGATKEDGREQATINVTGREYSFDLPDTVAGGFVAVNFRNEGKLAHEAAFVKTEPEAPQDQFIRDLKTATSEEGGPIAPHLKPYFVSAEVKAGERSTARHSLPAGTYYLVCTLTDADSVEGQPEEQEGEERPRLPQHFEQGMIKKVTVTGPTTVALPQAEKVISGKEYAFDITGFTAGNNEFLFRNDGPNQIHMVVVLEFPEGVDERAADNMIKGFTSDQPPPPGTPEPQEAGFGGVFEVGGGSLFNVNARAERVYGFLCFIQDRAGGPPHVAQGMYKVMKPA